MSDSKRISSQKLDDLIHHFHPQKLNFEQSESSENLWVRDDTPYYFMDTGRTWRLFKMIKGEAKPKKELLKSGINEQIVRKLLDEMDFTIS